MILRIGTRGSKLALWQANKTCQLLQGNGYQTEISIIHTVGDLNLTKPLHELGSQGLFTKALDEALLKNEIDIAVHSSKDIPGIINDELLLAGALEREEPLDVLLSLRPEIHLENQSQNFVIGTSSVRRIAFLKYYFPQHQVKDIRGNLDSRIEKLENGEYDALILAYAGVKRMGYEHLIRQKLSPFVFIPAVSQGAIGLMVRENDILGIEAVHKIRHEPTTITTNCEREYLKTIQGGCQLPVFGYSFSFMEELNLIAGIADKQGKFIIKEEGKGSIFEPEKLGIEVGYKVLNQGGKEILHASKS